MSKEMIQQSCRGCYWYDHNRNCKLGRLDKFAANGATIEQGIDSPIIKGRHCLAYRKETWANDKPKANLDVILRAEMLVRTDVYIYVDKYDQSKLEKTIASLQKQILKPMAAVVICDCIPQHQKLIDLMDKSGLVYEVKIYAEKMGRNKAIDLAAKKSSVTYYQILDQGQCLHSDWLAALDEAINDHLQRFLYIKASETQGETVNMTAHANFCGNEPCNSIAFGDASEEGTVLNNILEKLEFAGKVNGNTHYIIKQEDIRL